MSQVRFAIAVILALLLLAGSGCAMQHGDQPTPSVTPVSEPTVLPTATTPATPSPTAVPALPTETPPPTATKVAAIRAPRPRPTPIPLESVPDVRMLKPVPDAPSAELAQLIASFLADKQGVFGVAVKHLETGESAFINEKRQYEAASLYKLNLMFGAYELVGKGETSFDRLITVSERAAYGYDDGEPTLQPGETIALWEAVELAIIRSDNTCAHALLEALPVWKINQSFRQLGLVQTEINNGTRTSPLDMLRLMELIATGRAVSPAASAEMLGIMLRQEINDRLPYLLPPNVPIAHKTANLYGLRHDAGIVYSPAGPYAIAVLVDELPDAAVGANTAEQDIAELSRLVYDYFAGRESQR